MICCLNPVSNFRRCFPIDQLLPADPYYPLVEPISPSLKFSDFLSSQWGAVQALLRREGLYSSHLTQWRKQREKGELLALSRKRGAAGKEKNPLTEKLRVLERENARLKARAERAEGLVELQKKVSEILGIELKQSGGKD
jgi:hypothetical protein